MKRKIKHTHGNLCETSNTNTSVAFNGSGNPPLMRNTRMCKGKMQRQFTNDVDVPFVADDNVQEIQQPFTLDGVFKSRRLRQAMSAASSQSLDVSQHLLKTNGVVSTGNACCHRPDNVGGDLFWGSSVSPSKTDRGVIDTPPQIPHNCATGKHHEQVDTRSASAVTLPLFHQEIATCSNPPQSMAYSSVNEAFPQINGETVAHVHTNETNEKTGATSYNGHFPKHQLTTEANVCCGSSLETDEGHMVSQLTNVHENCKKRTRAGASSTRRVRSKRLVTKSNLCVAGASIAASENQPLGAMPAQHQSTTSFSVGESSTSTNYDAPHAHEKLTSGGMDRVNMNHPKTTRAGPTSTRYVKHQRSKARSTFCVGESSTSMNEGATSLYEDLGDCIYACRYCKAAFWYGERLKGHDSGNRQPKYTLCCRDGKLYVYDTQNEVQNRMNHFKGSDKAALDPAIVGGLIHFLDDHNELVQIFRTARDKCAEADVPDFKVRLYNGDGARTYELPTSDALGAIVFDSGPTTQSDYDVIIEYRDGPAKRINKLHQSYMSLQFPLIFIYGQPDPSAAPLALTCQETPQPNLITDTTTQDADEQNIESQEEEAPSGLNPGMIACPQLVWDSKIAIANANTHILFNLNKATPITILEATPEQDLSKITPAGTAHKGAKRVLFQDEMADPKKPKATPGSSLAAKMKNKAVMKKKQE
ncbi:DNA helicase Pif1-like protein [Artemisia annua]|uniref:DNA helicase Pif1-like protein n=1 Tax=Artemisia annua TaxID=35608 RepID=A0A2U1NRP6_ARTAN|nr:DNA helicase Pif1-like protein [Artemisia annua]